MQRKHPSAGGFLLRGRRGLTLIEILVVIAIIGLIAAVGIPSIQGILDLRQRAAAKEIAQTYTWLIDEAALRNVTFRIGFNLDRNSWLIEAGDPTTLVFSNPEAREKFDEDLEDAMSRFTQREIEEGQTEDIEVKKGRFVGLEDVAFVTAQHLPSGTHFAYVYTPQYGEDGARPTEDGPPEDEAEDMVAYTYVFPDGTAEHAVVRIVDDDEGDEGWTIEVLPMSGEVRLSTDLVDPKESLAWVPDEAPELR